MTEENTINEFESILTDLTTLGGQQEQTTILPNAIVINAAPSGLTNYIIVRDPRDGNYIPALKVAGISYAANDFVNLLFVKGTEPIAFQHGSASTGSNIQVDRIWESDFGAVAAQADASGNVTFHQHVILDGAAKAVKGSGSNAPDLGTTTAAEMWGSLFMAAGEKIQLPSGSLLLNIGTGGTTPALSLGNGLVVRNNTSAADLAAIYILGDNTGFSSLAFADEDSSIPGYLEYDHSLNQLTIRVDGSDSLWILSGKKYGLNTATVPHGGTGAAMLALDGTNASASAGPHIQVTTTADDYPVYQLYSENHDSIFWLLDSYFDGTNFRSSDAGSNLAMIKQGDFFRFYRDDGIAQGSVITVEGVIALNLLNGNVSVGVGTPSAKLDVDQSSTTAAIAVMILEQADLSEEYIDFIASSTGAGDPIDTVTAVGTAYARARVAVNGTFKYIQLYNA